MEQIETVKLIVYIISLTVTVLIMVFSLLSKSKNKKLKDLAIRSLKVLDYCKDAVIFAETFINLSGEDKKKLAMEKVIEVCIKNDVIVNQDEISDDIEKIIEISKKVNNKE